VAPAGLVYPVAGASYPLAVVLLASVKMPRAKEEKPIGRHWLRKFYQFCGLDPARAEIAIAKKYEEDPELVNRGGKGAPKKSNRTAIFAACSVTF
jgi:hypothetical protein